MNEIPRDAQKRIAKTLITEFDIITLDDTHQMLVKSNNSYKFKEPNFFNRLNELINETALPYSSAVSNITQDIKHRTLYNRDDFCYDKWVINFENGYYDIESDVFFPNGDLKFFYEIPHQWDDKEHDCSKFKQALKDWLGKDNPVKPNDIFEMIGLIMSMNTSYKKAFFFYGNKDSGKTTLQSIIMELIGKRNISEISLQRLSQRFGTHGMQFKILNMCGELSDRIIIETDQIKLLIGGDKYIHAEPKGRDFYIFRNTVKLLFASNFIPRVLNIDDDAFFDRFILINFPNSFKKNPDFVETIIGDEEELRGIIYESVMGFKRLRERGNFRKEIVEHTNFTWKYKSDSLFAYIHDFCQSEVNNECSSSDFLEKYNDYRMKRKERQITSKGLTKELSRFGIFKNRTTIDNQREYVFKGISIREDETDEN